MIWRQFDLLGPGTKWGPAKNMHWLSKDELAQGMVITIHVWRTLPFAAVILLAGLSAIPKDINDAAATSTSIASLTAGTWYFAVRAVNSKQAESDNSNVAQRSVTGASAAKTLAITITAGTPPPPPPPPTTTLKMTATSVYDIVWSNGVRNLGRVVGTAPIGTPCQSTIKVGTSYYKVNKSAVKITTQPRSTNVVAKCALS